jgi:hypothetical protein
MSDAKEAARLTREMTKAIASDEATLNDAAARAYNHLADLGEKIADEVKRSIRVERFKGELRDKLKVAEQKLDCLKGMRDRIAGTAVVGYITGGPDNWTQWKRDLWNTVLEFHTFVDDEIKLPIEGEGQ